MARLALALALAACHAPAQPAPLANTSRPESWPALDSIHHLDGPPLRPREHDCRLSTVLLSRFPGAHVRACGSLPDYDQRARDEAKACVLDAIHAGDPFVYEELHDTMGDGYYVLGMLAVGHRGALENFTFIYNRTCPTCEGGDTTLWPCKGWKETPDNSECLHEGDVANCFDCQSAGDYQECQF